MAKTSSSRGSAPGAPVDLDPPSVLRAPLQAFLEAFQKHASPWPQFQTEGIEAEEKLFEEFCLHARNLEEALRRLRGSTERTKIDVLRDRYLSVRNCWTPLINVTGRRYAHLHQLPHQLLELLSQPTEAVDPAALARELAALDAEMGPLSVVIEERRAHLETAPFEAILEFAERRHALGRLSLRLLIYPPSGNADPRYDWWRFQAHPHDSQHNYVSNIHPHVHVTGDLCLGQAKGPTAQAMREGRLGDAFLLARSILAGYAGRDHFASLEVVQAGLRRCPGVIPLQAALDAEFAATEEQRRREAEQRRRESEQTVQEAARLRKEQQRLLYNARRRAARAARRATLTTTPPPDAAPDPGPDQEAPGVPPTAPVPPRADPHAQDPAVWVTGPYEVQVVELPGTHEVRTYEVQPST